MRILALETATGSCTVAVVDGERVLSEISLQVPRAHSTRLMPLIAQAIEESGLARTDLDAIAVGIGPGSFTGLRIGLATAKGLAFALNKPCVGVSTLQSLAYGSGAQVGLVVPMLDAKRGDVYGAIYAAGDRNPASWEELLPPSHIHVDQLAEEIARFRAERQHTWQYVTCCGDVAVDYAERLAPAEVVRIAPVGSLMPRASAVAAIGASLVESGRAVEPEALVPVYLRKSEAERLWAERRSSSTP